ncbi:MAG TPA: carbohydrate ABC transporter permease [Stellaceae bacterium]|nr:carbohydrate ABC transporter permease [Stellaceae bacterium]
MSAAALAAPRYRVQRRIAAAGSALLGMLLLVWSLTPVYNMFLIALDPEEGEIEFDGNIYPPEISFQGFADALSQEARYLEEFWHQFGNSIYLGLLTMLLTVLIASLASFAVSRMRLKRGQWLVNAGLLTYTVPASCLVIPLYRIMHGYGLGDNPWAVIAAQVTFAAPFAVVILQQYSRLIPTELDEAARLDGASSLQLYLRIYLPLMLPALGVVASYALVIAWNDYIYQFVLLTSSRHTTVSIMQAQLFTDTDAPWNAMMAAAIIYAAPPIAVFFLLHRYVSGGLRFGRAIR